ncbi:MAG: hypothetical protein IPJ82_16295 [Lewinellaceae bacterium]|nr:hypothetical protein [Lewinellaceae bacterium]
MRNTTISLSTFCAIISILVTSCKTQPDAWADFTRCAENTCVKEALAVQAAFLKDPKSMLAQFSAAYRKGDDHVIGWLYLLRDSVLTNPAYASVEERKKMQSAIIAAAGPFIGDRELGEMAKSVLNEIATLTITAAREAVPDNDPEAIKLVGTWVSTDDTRSVISLENGIFTETYGGEQMSRFPYRYFAQCPQDCNPVAETPCIKVIGQDDVCYVVVKSDESTLELSPIGGTGNTLVYRRK